MKEIESFDSELRQIKSKIETIEGTEVPRLLSKQGEVEVELEVLTKQRNKLLEKCSEVKIKRDSDVKSQRERMSALSY